MKRIHLILLISLLLFSCAKDGELDRTIFIPEDDDSYLPAYTEWGYNSFGAEYERDYFLVSNKIMPCKIMYHNNQLQFSLHGILKKDHTNMVMLFTFPFTQMVAYKDLVQLNSVKIDLAANDCVVKILQDSSEMTLNVLDGELYFKRTQLLSIDDIENRVILSGTFDLRFLQNGFPSTISDGRFDLGITKNLFYAY